MGKGVNCNLRNFQFSKYYRCDNFLINLFLIIILMRGTHLTNIVYFFAIILIKITPYLFILYIFFKSTLFNLSALASTDSELNAMAILAIIGFKTPIIASGMPMML